MATSVTLPAVTLPTVKPQAVYWKQRWNSSWQVDTRLWCESAEWTVQPAMPVANFSFRYGVKLQPGDTAFLARPHPGDRLQYFVKVVYQTQDSPLTWVGVIDCTLDDVQALIDRGGGNRYDSGRLHLVAYGLERLLDDCYLTTAYTSNGNGGTLKVNRPLAFNPAGEPNRAQVGDAEGIKLFQGSPGDTPVYWNTRDAVRYLLKYHGPKSDSGDSLIPFQLDDSALLPNWDQPSVETHDASLRQLLNAFIPRQRCLGWRCVVESDSGPVLIKPFTWLGSEISLEGVNGGTIRANPVQITIDAGADRSAQIGVKRSVQDRVDQVICRGAQRTSTGNFCKPQSSLDQGWKHDLEVEYWTGGNTDPAWPADLHDRMTFAYTFRSKDRFLAVFRRYILPSNWNGKVGDGIGGSAGSVLMPADDGSVTPLCAEDWRFLRELPFRLNYDYHQSLTSPTKLPSADGKHDFLAPLVLFPRTTSTPQAPKYIQADLNGLNNQIPQFVEAEDVFSVRSEIKREDGALWLDPPDGFAHLVDKTATQVLGLLDIDEIVKLDWRDAILVATVPWSEFSTGVYPNAIAETDCVRQLTLDLGPQFRCDYVAPDTIVGLKPDGTLIRVYAGGYLRDDRPLLRALARAAYEFYFPVRAALDLSTSYLTAAIPLASYVTTLTDQLTTRTLNTVVTRLAVSSPLVESEQATETPPPKLFVETGHGELDALKLLGGATPRAAHPKHAHHATRL